MKLRVFNAPAMKLVEAKTIIVIISTSYTSILHKRIYTYRIVYIVQVLAMGEGVQGEGQDVYNCPPLKTDMKQLFCFWPRLTLLDRGGAPGVPVYTHLIVRKLAKNEQQKSSGCFVENAPVLYVGNPREDRINGGLLPTSIRARNENVVLCTLFVHILHML